MKKVIILTFAIILLISVSGFTYGDIPASERAALIALYNSTNGDNWTDNIGWKTPPLHTDGFAMPGTEGSWYGITVSDNQTKWIELNGNNLTGSLPPELGNISNLRELRLGWNQLIGSLPPELGNLSKLTWLVLSANQLSGNIPPELGNTNLGEISLSHNQLSGSIPPELGNLDYLACLYLHSNMLSGSIPAELGNLTRLFHLYLNQNQLSGSIPPELGNLSKMQWLYLGSNMLTGNIPEELGNLTEMRSLSLESNQLIGSIPTSLSNLKNATIQISYNGLYASDDSLRIFLNSHAIGWEETQTIAPSNILATPISSSSVRITWTPITYLRNSGGYRIYYYTSGDQSWTDSGILTSDKLAWAAKVTGLSMGTTYYFSMKALTNSNPWNDNEILSDRSSVVSATPSSMLETTPPFGSFDTPVDGSTVASSIAVTGWALDGSGVDFIKIYRASGENLVFIGDALMVEGARPDVAATYPGYPFNTKAGWGYMMLTNSLPNSGNGTFVLHAIATDVVGNKSTLGIKTIHVDNINAVKPFGAIDTPTQGGIASGANYVNWGWALTPLPHFIPIDGSTINVWVDGFNLGHPNYNLYRPDIANFFPGYANTDGAVGYFYINTTNYDVGVHTIQWTVEDSAGNMNGIGSRYFTIISSGADANISRTMGHRQMTLIEMANFDIDNTQPILVQKGFSADGFEDLLSADDIGESRIQIKELEPVGIKFTEDSRIVSVYQLVGNNFKKMPAGMSVKNNTIHWMPGIAYLGDFRFVAVVETEQGVLFKKFFKVTIKPKQIDNKKR